MKILSHLSSMTGQETAGGHSGYCTVRNGCRQLADVHASAVPGHKYAGRFGEAPLIGRDIAVGVQLRNITEAVVFRLKPDRDKQPVQQETKILLRVVWANMDKKIQAIDGQSCGVYFLTLTQACLMKSRISL